MKLLSIKILMGEILMGAAFFLMLSCGTVDYVKKYPKMIANVEPFSVGTIEAQFDRMLSSKLNKTEINVVFHPRLAAVALEFKYELFTHRQFWDEEGRKQFAAALERYKADYAERNLINKPRRTRAIYGKVQGQSEWEASKLTKTRAAFPVISLGYRFKNDMPYFMTLMRSAPEYDDSAGTPNLGDSPQITMYFTRAQADELVKLFDQNYLMASLESNTGLKAEDTKGFLGIDWSLFKRKDSSKPDRSAMGDSYEEDEGEQ